MDAPGPSNGYPNSASKPTVITATVANGHATHNGNGVVSGYPQYSPSSTSTAGFNGQIVTGMTPSNGGMPKASGSPLNGNATQSVPTPQSIQPAVINAVKQPNLEEEYYNAERARQQVASFAAATSQLFTGGAPPAPSTSGQKQPKLEGLPTGVIPAGGIRKPKQQRAPRSDVAPATPAAGAAAAATPAAAAASSSSLVVPLDSSPVAAPPVANGAPVRRPDANATGGEIVAYLMSFNIQTAEADFSSKALESLHKKIKDRPHDMEAFMRCVETKGEVLGNCITVTRTLDGRLQVAGRKGFPHVIYTKIFRFQELHKNELKSIPQCIYGFDNKAEDEKAKERHQNGQRAQNGYLATASMIIPNEEHKPDAQVCVNPYHYERVTAPSGGNTLIDPLTGLLRVNALHSMDEMMDFATSSMKQTAESSSGRGGTSMTTKTGQSGNWPVVDIDDDEEDAGGVKPVEPKKYAMDSTGEEDVKPANPSFPQLAHFQNEYLAEMQRLYAAQAQSMDQPGCSRTVATTSSTMAMIGGNPTVYTTGMQPVQSLDRLGIGEQPEDIGGMGRMRTKRGHGQIQPTASSGSLQIEAMMQQVQMTSPPMKMTRRDEIPGQPRLLFPTDPSFNADPFPPTPTQPISFAQLARHPSVESVQSATSIPVASLVAPASVPPLHTYGLPSSSVLPAAAAAAPVRQLRMGEEQEEFAAAEEEMLRQHEAVVERLRQKKAVAEARKAQIQQGQQQLLQLQMQMNQPGISTVLPPSVQHPSQSTSPVEGLGSASNPISGESLLLAQMARMFSRTAEAPPEEQVAPTTAPEPKLQQPVDGLPSEWTVPSQHSLPGSIVPIEDAVPPEPVELSGSSNALTSEEAIKRLLLKEEEERKKKLAESRTPRESTSVSSELNSQVSDLDDEQPSTSKAKPPPSEREQVLLKKLGFSDGDVDGDTSDDSRAGRLGISRRYPSSDPEHGFLREKKNRFRSSNFLQARPSMLEEMRLSNPPSQGGFGYSGFDVKPTVDKAGSSKESTLSPQTLSEAFAKAASEMSPEEAEKLSELMNKLRQGVSFDDNMGESSSDGGDGLAIHNHVESESDRTHDEANEATTNLKAIASETYTYDKMIIESGKEKKMLDDMKKEQEEADAEMIHPDDEDYPDEMMTRQRRAQEFAEHQKKHAKREEQIARMMIERDEDFANIEEATIWNAQYTDDNGRPCFYRKNKWTGDPPNTNVIVGDTGNGTFGSKGPHLKPRQRLSKLEWSLQQVVRMLARCSSDESIDTIQWMLCCQHYAGMIKKTAAAASLDPQQMKLCEVALERVKEAGGGTVTHQQLHYWDISRLFANHIKTLPERREEQEERRRAELQDMDNEWTFDVDSEINKLIADTKDTDGEKIVPDSLMDCEELKSPAAKAFDERRRKRKAAEGLDEEMDPNDHNGLFNVAEENGEQMDIDPLLPVLENVFTAADLYALLESPNEYLRSFRDAIFGADLAEDWEDEMDMSLRSVVPPKDGDTTFQPFDGRERENDEPDENGEERPPFKKNCLCPGEKKNEHCFWGKHHHYMQGVSREIVDAAFLLYKFRIQRKKSIGPAGELYNFASSFNCPKVCMKRSTEIEPHSAKMKPANYHWCAINYCERDKHVGAMRQVEDVNFFIDGGFDAVHEQRYCVSTLRHPLTQYDKQVHDVRSRIGCGVRISVKEDGSMWVRVLSRYPVFIQSTFLDREAGLVNGDAIHKIYPGSAIKAFDLIRARRSILQMYDYQSEALKLHNGEKSREDLPYPLCNFNRRELRAISRIGGDDMQRHAVVKIGFIKGWGPEFEYKRICETPCWVEIINNRACEFIDHVMNLRQVSYAFSELDSSDYDE